MTAYKNPEVSLQPSERGEIVAGACSAVSKQIKHRSSFSGELTFSAKKQNLKYSD